MEQAKEQKKILNHHLDQAWFYTYNGQVHVDEILAQCNGEYSSSNPLKVTILTPGWKGLGASVMMRELAKQLANFPQLKVTVLVPENSGLSEQDKREAQSQYKLTIVEAKKHPGFVDPIEWLNFPPADLHTDIVVAFGEKLGKIAQYWKERNQCKTIHLFSDPLFCFTLAQDPFESYSKETRKGLCEVADICVATGSKVSDILTASLCHKKKRVFNLTPGIISDLCDTKRCSNDGEKFRVLLVGGDNTDNFQEEGLEIAAKAVRELHDKSCHLIYVGAGKERKQQFSELFQQCSVAKRQLTIRGLPKDDEEWKRLFCEVDLAIMPGEKEFGLEALLALSAGLPVLVHGESGFGEALKEVTFGTSAIVDSDDATEWATVIKRVKETDRKTRLQEAAELRSNYDKMYSWEKQCGALVGVMFMMVSGQRNPSTEIQALQDKIMEMLRKEPYMGEKRPLKWINFEKIVDALVAQNIHHIDIEKLQTYAKDVCFIVDEEEFKTMVNFYHDLGIIIKHRSTVVLKAQWLKDLFRQLITIPHFNNMDAIVANHWQEVQKSGVLSMELVDHVFEKFLLQGVVRDDILNMMEHFGLIAKFSPSTTDVKYFVPAQLKESPDAVCAVKPSSSDPCPLYICFLSGCVPHGLFTQLVSHFISWCSEAGPPKPPTLYRNGAWFVIGRQVVHDFILTCKKQFIKVVLRQRSQSQLVLGDKSTDHEMAVQVREFVDGTLQSLSRNLPYLRGLQYKFHVECPYCGLESKKCTNHSEVSCAHEDCLHLLEITQGDPLICEKKPCIEVLRVDGLEKWFSPTTSQTLNNTGKVPGNLLEPTENKSPETPRDPPEVTVTLLKKEDLPKKSKPWDDIQRPVDILLLAVKDCAFLACLSYLNADFSKIYTKVLGHVYIGNMGEDKSKLRIAVIQCDVGSTCPGGSAVVVPNAVGLLMPKAVFCVGLCGGLNFNKVKLGDVVVLKKLITYAPSKVTDNGIEEGGVKVPLKPLLSKLTRSPDDGWKAPLKDPKDLKVQVHRGAFLSGPEVVDSNERRKALINRFPEAVAIEMEGEGLYAAAHDLDIEWIVIKGVSDYADGRKYETDSWRQFASLMAASLTAHILSDHIVFQDWPHYESENEFVNQRRYEQAARVLPSISLHDSLPHGEGSVKCRKRKSPCKEDNAGRQTTSDAQLTQGPAKVARYEIPATTGQVMDDIQPTQGGFFNVFQQMKQLHDAREGPWRNTNTSVALKNIASDKGLVVSDNQGGGNCMFHALSEQLGLVKGIPITHHELRKKVVHYLENNPALLKREVHLMMS